MYAYVVAGEIVTTIIGLPDSGTRLDTGETVPNLGSQPVEVQQACGYFVVAETDKPTEDPRRGVYYRSETIMNGGVPTLTWVQRVPLEAGDATEHEVAQATAADLSDFQADLAGIDDFLADPDVQRVLDQPNNTPLETSDLNRALKAMVRQERRSANLLARIGKLVIGEYHPEALEL